MKTRLYAVLAAATLLAGCAGSGTTQPPQSSVLPLAQAQSETASSSLNARRNKCPAWSAGTGILNDGDFHDAMDTFVYYYAGTRFAKGWVVTKRSIEIDPSDHWPIPGPVCSIDLDGASVGGISHARFATTPSVGYTVTFLFSGNGSCGPEIKTMRVRAAGQSEILTWNLASQGSANNGNWLTETWNFTAVGSRTKLEFTSLDRPVTSGCGPVVAAISVTQN